MCRSRALRKSVQSKVSNSSGKAHTDELWSELQHSLADYISTERDTLKCGIIGYFEFSLTLNPSPKTP